MSRPAVVDLRALPPPEPLLHILETLAPGEGRFIFLLAREPRPLYPLLAADGWEHATRLVEQGFEVTVFRRLHEV